MNIKKNCGIVLIVLGIILTLDRTNEFKGIVSIIVYYIQEYLPLFITFCGVSLLATHDNKNDNMYNVLMEETKK